jgi:hypothetical protein
METWLLFVIAVSNYSEAVMRKGEVRYGVLSVTARSRGWLGFGCRCMLFVDAAVEPGKFSLVGRKRSKACTFGRVGCNAGSIADMERVRLARMCADACSMLL